MNEILVRIKKIINSNGITDSQFSKICDIPQTTMANMFIRDSFPKADMLTKIIKCYNINPDWLLTGSGEMTNTKDIALKKTVANVPILKNKIPMNESLSLDNPNIIDDHIALSSMFPIPKENLAAFIMNDSSMVGAGFKMQDILFLDTRPCGLDDDAYVFIQNGNVYCRVFLFEEISGTVKICAMHKPEVTNVEILNKVKISELEKNYKLIGKVLACLRKNKLF
ncbi:MAG: helix-turn-helix transcriptional regulator [Paludibacteraceae bacterium]|nr:helix-turn-helix transcriptional regulator [Paludibacteraceae bacterium]